MLTQHNVKRIFFLIGLFLLIYLFRKVGRDTLFHDFRLVGWYFLVILLLSGIKYAVSALAWANTFFPDERQSWPALFAYRLVGEGMNYLSVAGPLLGEPVKASLLRGVSFTPALASTLLETSANATAAGFVTGMGLIVLVFWHAPGNVLRYAGYAAIVILLTLASGFVYAVKYRLPFLTWVWQRLRHIPALSSPKLGENLTLIEGRMHRLSAERPTALLAIFLLSFISQGLALLEIYAVILPLGISPGLSSVLVMEAFTKLAKTLFFFIPARVGADEGSSASIFALLRLSPAAGVTLALARRLRAIFWSAVGLAFLFAQSIKSESRGFGTETLPSSESADLRSPAH